MADRVRAGRGVDDRDVVRKSNPLQRAAQGARAAGGLSGDRPHGARAAAARDGLRAGAGSAVSSITYNGHDFSEHVTAELVEPAGHALEPRALAVPGRPGAVLLGSELPPRSLTERLFLDAGVTLTAEERSATGHE